MVDLSPHDPSIRSVSSALSKREGHRWGRPECRPACGHCRVPSCPPPALISLVLHNILTRRRQYCIGRSRRIATRGDPYVNLNRTLSAVQRNSRRGRHSGRPALAPWTITALVRSTALGSALPGRGAVVPVDQADRHSGRSLRCRFYHFRADLSHVVRGASQLYATPWR
jgi:hypothetical protein